MKNITEEIIKNLEKAAAMQYFKWEQERGEFEQFSFDKGVSFCQIEKTGEDYILRNFVAVSDGEVSGEWSARLPIRFEEVDSNVLTEQFVLDSVDVWDPLISFEREGIKDGDFKYAIASLEKAENETMEEIMNSKEISHKMTFSKNSLFPIAISFCPFVEKMANLLSPEENFEDIVLNTYGSLREELERVFGNIDYSQTELNKMLGVSKALLKTLVARSEVVSHLAILKEIFKGNEAFLLQLNAEASEALCEYITNYICDEYYNASEEIESIGSLIRIFGVQNIRGYMDFLAKNIHEQLSESKSTYHFVCYNEYMQKVEVLGGAAAGFQWKLVGEELERADKSITEAYEIQKDKVRCEKTLAKFEAQYKEWEHYEYSADGFGIKYPRNPEELIKEGVQLNHCVKTFISDVADGSTTILFIRKQERPDKPFYTLEIKAGRIHQCHGIDNCNIDACDGLKDFLVKFCNEKGVDVGSVDNADGLFGGGGDN